MSDLADAEQRARDAARLREEARIDELRARLSTLRGRTVILDVSDAYHQHAHVHASIVDVSKEAIEIVDLGDASVPPSKKPAHQIELARIRSARIA